MGRMKKFNAKKTPATRDTVQGGSRAEGASMPALASFYIGRQPIFDAGLEVIGYELLYRHRRISWSHIVSGDQATSQIILHSFWELGLGRIVDRHKAFVNVTRNFVMNSDLLPPPSDQLVIEILEDIMVDDGMIEAVGKLKRAGYTIALDDFIFHQDLRPLISLADIVKLDVQVLNRQQLEEHVRILREYPVKLLAEKIETPEQHDMCRQLGFDYYQGYFLCRPRVLSGRRLPSSRINIMRIVARLHGSELDVEGLEEVLSHDPALSYRLLRYINSAAFGLPKLIDSIRHAVVYLGAREIRRWASVVALAAIDDKPHELVKTSLIRAKMCELLATSVSQGSGETAFIVGLFSLLDALMDQPLERILAALPLSPEITEALLSHNGPYGAQLETILAYERGAWDQIERIEGSYSDLPAIYMTSTEWADQTARDIFTGVV
jgi:EAL and modified HD-GYP domain-containing signal transduction protein